MSTQLIVETEMQRVAAEYGKCLAPLACDLMLTETGLDSLCFAVLVARLEDLLGVDPFTASDQVQFPVRVGEFVQLYEKALPQSS